MLKIFTLGWFFLFFFFPPPPPPPILFSFPLVVFPLFPIITVSLLLVPPLPFPLHSVSTTNFSFPEQFLQLSFLSYFEYILSFPRLFCFCHTFRHSLFLSCSVFATLSVTHFSSPVLFLPHFPSLTFPLLFCLCH
jgi:hypothetical protein